MTITKVSTGLIEADAASVNLNIDENTLYIDVTTNRVGIGNTNPSTALDVTGSVTASSTLTAQKLVSTEGILELDDNGTHDGIINSPASLIINIDSDANSTGEDFIIAKDRTSTSGGTELFRVQEDGNVGIGTSPSTKLHVADGADSNAQIRINGSTSTVYSRLYSDNNGVLAIGTDGGNQAANSYMMFEVKGSERLRIDAAGNVGIGTSSPAVLLDIKEGTAATDAIIGLTAGTGGRAQIRSEAQADNTSSELSFYTMVGSATSERMRIDASGNAGFGVLPKTDYETNYKSSLEFPYGGLTGNTSGIETALVSNSYRSADGSWKRLRAGYATRAMLNAGSGSDPFTITYAGTSSAGSVISWNEAMRIDASGNVGIGESSIGSNALEIRRSGASGIVLKETGVAQFYVEQDTDAKLRITNSKNLIFSGGANGTTERMRIDASGNLLVGTASGSGVSAPDNSATASDAGVRVSGDGYIGVGIDSNPAMYLNRMGSNGDVLRVKHDGGLVGSIGTEGGDSLYIQSDGTGGAGLRFHPSTATIDPVRNRARIDQTISLGVEAARFKDLYLSGGVVLDENPSIVSTTVAARTIGSKTLDDYEEGTWTTTFGTLTNLTGTPVLTEARYTKIGNLVSLSGYITGTTVTSAGIETLIVLDAPFLMESNSAQHTGSSFWAGSVRQNGVVSPNSGSNSDAIVVLLPGHSWTGNGNLNVAFTFTYQSA